MVKLIFGCGYLGQRVAARWRSDGHEVVVVTRNDERAHSFEQQGYRAIVADVARLDSLAPLPRADTVLFAVGYDRTAPSSIMDVYAGGVRNVLETLPKFTGRFIYISTTGVYGPAGGAWIDESTPPDPQRDGGRASLAAEHALASSHVTRGVILRLAGIYGPGRVPMLKEIAAGQPIGVPGLGYLNLIHVDDAASVILAADDREHHLPKEASQLPSTRIYCVSDGRPVRRADFYREVARRLGAPPPTFFEPEAESPRALRARGDRRVSNARMRAELNVTLAYPDYRAGLAAILETENQ